MDAKRAIGCMVLLSAIPYLGRADVAEPATNEAISAWYQLLCAVYDDDPSLIPDEPNEIQALETSSEQRDQLAWEIFNQIRYELDPNSRPVEEEITFADGSLSVVVENAPTAALAMTSEAELVSVAETESPADFGAGSGLGLAGVGMMSMESLPELSGPLGSCIIEPGTYRIASLPLQIEGHVVIPAGVKLIAPYDPNNNIIEVMPGGLLETGKAAFYTEEDHPDILPSVEILSEDPNFIYCHNIVGIYVHRGADPGTRIDNITIENCIVGLIIDESLDCALRNVITFGCYDGIHLYAPAQLVDCEFWSNGTVWIGPCQLPGNRHLCVTGLGRRFAGGCDRSLDALFCRCGVIH